MREATGGYRVSKEEDQAVGPAQDTSSCRGRGGQNGPRHERSREEEDMVVASSATQSKDVISDLAKSFSCHGDKLDWSELSRRDTGCRKNKCKSFFPLLLLSVPIFGCHL